MMLAMFYYAIQNKVLLQELLLIQNTLPKAGVIWAPEFFVIITV